MFFVPPPGQLSLRAGKDGTTLHRLQREIPWGVSPGGSLGMDEALREPTMNSLSALNVKIYADGADKAGMLELYRNPLIQGMTTNPTLMKKAGITDYEAFAKDILQTVTTKPISFEVFADDFKQMR